MKRNVLVIGAGAVAQVVCHKLAQNNDVFGKMYIGSRTLKSCDAILDSIKKKKNYKNPDNEFSSKQIDVFDVPALIELIKQLNISIVINVASAFCNMSILEACIQTGSAYIDTAIHEDPNKVCENPPW